MKSKFSKGRQKNKRIKGKDTWTKIHANLHGLKLTSILFYFYFKPFESQFFLVSFSADLTNQKSRTELLHHDIQKN